MLLDNFDQKVMKHVSNEDVRIEQLFLDDLAKEMFEQVNPCSLLRNSNDNIEDSSFLFNILCLHSPILCYSYRKSYKVLLGSLTLLKLNRGLEKKVLPKDFSVPVKLLKFKPEYSCRRGLIQYDITSNIMTCFTSDTKKISSLLKVIFNIDHGKKSIFQSNEWLSLFPLITSSKKLAAYLAISEKDL